MQEGERLTVYGFVDTMFHELPILTGAVFPLLTVLIAWAAGADLNSAIDAALWTAGATIVILEIIAGVRTDLSGRQLVVQTLVGAVLGLLVLALRLALH